MLWPTVHLELRNLTANSESEPYVTTDGQSASLSWNIAPIWGLRQDFYYCQTVAGLLMWGVLSDERTGLSFTIDASPPPRSHSRVRVPRNSWPLSQIRDSPQPGGPSHRIYILQGQGGPVIPPGTGIPFRRLLRLAGLRWKYSTPPPHVPQRKHMLSLRYRDQPVNAV
jgi:hypothetical protein